MFAPVLVKQGQLSQSVDPRIQDLVVQLEAGLGTVIRQQGREGVAPVREGEGRETLGILTVTDEYRYWVEQAESSTRLQTKERAQYFQELLQPLASQFDRLDSLPLDEALELIDTGQDQLDDLWKQTDHDPAYPEERMLHLLEMVSGNLARFAQRHLKDLDFWSGQFKLVHTGLHECLMLCDKWAGAAEDLTTRFWKQFTAHPWKGGAFVSETLTQVTRRIEEVREGGEEREGEREGGERGRERGERGRGREVRDLCVKL